MKLNKKQHKLELKKMKPSLYLYKQSEKGFELYFGETSTISGLKAINDSEQIRLTAIGATLYKKYGYATEKEFPKFNKTTKLIEFFNQVGEIGLIEFEIEIIGKGKMTSHDDGECHFTLKNKKDGIDILKKITPEHQSDLIIATLLKNKGIYISIDSENNITRFATFDEYIKTTYNNV